MPVFPAAKVVEVFAPATVANLGPGFDILGLALAEPYDIIRAERVDREDDMPPAFVDFISGDGGKLPREPEQNTASIAAAYVLQQLMIESTAIKITIEKRLPMESGMGSSAAGAVGGAVATNALFGNSLRREELIPACVE